MNRCILQQCLLQLQFVFFRHAACAHQTSQREFAKAAVCLYRMFYPQRRCRRQSVYCTYLFFLHVFQTKFKRKKHLPPQVLQQKSIFHSKKFVFYSILFVLHVFQTKFKRKKHLPPLVLQQKGIFHSKKFVFYSILFSCTFFKPSLSVKNIYHHKFYNKKAFFTQKNLFFTQFCYVLFI